jgi:hypothetical protein
MLRLLLALGVLLAIVFCFPKSGLAADDPKQQCVSASEKGQQLKNAGKLEAARAELQICSRAECPKLIQQDCTEWMKDILNILPSVVPGAKDRKGRDLVDVKVSIDGKVATETLDGKAVNVDPGVHVFRFEGKGMAPVEEQVVIRQGEKNRILTITLGAADEKDKPPPPPPPPPPSTKSSPPIAAFIVGGVGLVALGVGGYIVLDANTDASDLRETCAPQCKEEDVKSIEDRRLIGGITAGVGGALLVVGVILFFTHSSSGGGSVKSARSVQPAGRSSATTNLASTVASAWLHGIKF